MEQEQKTETKKPLFECVVTMYDDGTIQIQNNPIEGHELDDLAQLRLLSSIGRDAEDQLRINNMIGIIEESTAQLIVNNYLKTLPTKEDVETIVKNAINNNELQQKAKITKFSGDKK